MVCRRGLSEREPSHLQTDGNGRKIGEKIFKHSGEGLAEIAAWLLAANGAGQLRPNPYRHRDPARTRCGDAGAKVLVPDKLPERARVVAASRARPLLVRIVRGSPFSHDVGGAEHAADFLALRSLKVACARGEGGLAEAYAVDIFGAYLASRQRRSAVKAHGLSALDGSPRQSALNAGGAFYPSRRVRRRFNIPLFRRDKSAVQA